MSYQRIIIQGNLTKDVEVRQLQGGSSVASFSVATTERFKKADGTIGEDTEYHDVEYWNPGNLAQYLLKGTSVLVEGKIKTDKWQDQNGQTQTRKRIRANTIQLCGSRPQSAAQPQQPPMVQGYPNTPQPAYPQGYPQGQPYVAQGPAPQTYWQGQQPAPQVPPGAPAMPPMGRAAQQQPPMAYQLDPANYPNDLPFDNEGR